jgi:UDP-4-amino-4-deoxy-L-arabinose formyltransferase/UDP-glucuronic acid dehydrogenase (UDP-4-keto-hexauronic acid decarboxylating)
LNVLLVGEESAGAQILKLLASSHHNLVGVMASPTRAATGGMTVWQMAEKMGCRTWPAELVKDPKFAEVVYAEKVDLLLNVHSLFVIKGEIVEAPRFGSFNLHPGPLPRYAGLNAPSWAIYRGEKVHGVTLHRMLAGIDTGTIAYQALFNIEEQDTGFSVSAKCIRAGLELIKQLLAQAADDPHAIPIIEQDFSQREYFGKATPQDGWLDWSRPAREVYNFVRAADYSPFASPWKHPRARWENQEIGFVKTALTGQRCEASPGTIGPLVGEQAQVACADEWLAIKRLIINGKHTNAINVLQPGNRLEWN